MQIYTYKECLPYLNQNKVMEEEETYQVRNQKHDKIFKEILEILKEVTKNDLDSDEKYFINLILKYLLPEKLSKDETKEILENLKGEEDDTMFIDILRKYFDDKEKEAVRTAVEETAKDTTKATTYELIREMLKNNADEDFIKRVTKISNQELKEIKAAM
ncbi:MAG: hypothetical protein V8R81_07955 [Clostridia bacterium]